MAVVPYLFIFQGIDFTDKGLTIALGEQMLKWPDVYAKYSPIWLTGAFTHVWFRLFPIKGLLGLNILFVLLLQLNAVLSYSFFRKYYTRSVLLPALCIGMIVSITLSRSSFGYHSFTVFVLSAAILALLNGLKENKGLYILLSGILCALSGLVRIPNILSVLFILYIILFYLLLGKKLSISSLSFFVVGLIVGFGIDYALIALTGFSHYYVSGVQQMFFHLKDAHNFHNPSQLASANLNDFISIIIQSTKYLVFFTVVIYAASFFQLAFINVSDYKRFAPLLFIASVFIAWFTARHNDAAYILKFHFKYVMPGILAALFILSASTVKNNLKEKILLLISTLLVYVVSFAGSSSGMNPAGLLLFLILCIAETLSFLDIPVTGERFINFFTRNFILFSLTILIILAAVINIKFVHRDVNNRAELRYSIHHPLLAGVYTNKQRADCVNGLLDALSSRVKPGDTLWAAPALPVMYPLTGCVPFARQVWEDGTDLENVPPNSFPLIIKAKGSVKNDNWPMDVNLGKDPDFLKEESVMNNFISSNHYTKKWENGFFEIWTR